MKIVVFSGYNYSKHVMVFMDLLRSEGIDIKKCIVVSEYSLKRLKLYYNQLDRNELVKKFKDRILGNIIRVKRSDEIRFIEEEWKRLGIKENTVSKYCLKHGISCITVNSLNDEKAQNFCSNADLGIYLGGGIIKTELLNKFSIGILNCHSAKLPEIRGMNTTEWSILVGIPPANTLHFMVRKLDMGPILEIIPHEYNTCKSIDEIRGKAIIHSVYDLVNVTKKILANKYSLTQQKSRDGKQYFTMHPILKNLINRHLERLHAEISESN